MFEVSKDDGTWITGTETPESRTRNKEEDKALTAAAEAYSESPEGIAEREAARLKVERDKERARVIIAEMEMSDKAEDDSDSKIEQVTVTVVEEELTASERAELDEQNTLEAQEIQDKLKTIRGDLVLTEDMLKEGLLKDTVLALLPYSQASLENILFTFMALFGNTVGRKPAYKMGEAESHANLWLIVEGKTGTGRKTQGLDLVKALFQQVDPKLTERAKTEIRTGAALGQLMDDNARPLYDRRLLITEEEGGDMLNNLYMKDNNLAGALLVMKDKGTTEKHVQGEDKFKVTGAHPTVVWNITKDTLLSNRSGFNRLLGKGFFNRFLHVRTWLRTASSDIPPLDWNSTSWKELIGRLQRAIEKAKDIERITLHPDANLLQQRWNNRETLTILNSVESGTNSTVQMLTARTAYLATQLQVLLAVIDGRDEITMVDVKASQMLMDYHTKSIRDIYLPSGSSPISSLSPIAQRMLKHFKSSSGARLTKSQIHRKLNDLKADQINIAIEELYDNNEITYDHDTWERNKQISGKKTEAFRVMGEQEKLGINRKKHG